MYRLKGVTRNGFKINNEMPNDELLDFLGLPSNTRVNDFEDICYSNFTCKPDINETVVFRYYKGSSYKVIVGYYNEYSEFLWRHNQFGYGWINMDGESTFLTCFLNDRCHNIVEPNVRYFNNKIVSEEYYVNDMYHNIQGPAVRFINFNNVWRNRFYIDGKELSMECFCNLASRRMGL